MITPESARRTRRLGLMLLAAAFFVGGLTGAAFDRVFAGETPPPARSATQCEPERNDRREDVFASLGLSHDQRARIDEILEHRREQTEAFWEEHGPLLRGIVDSARAEIRALLTPEQRAEYERMLAERRAAQRERRNSEGSSQD